MQQWIDYLSHVIACYYSPQHLAISCCKHGQCKGKQWWRWSCCMVGCVQWRLELGNQIVLWRIRVLHWSGGGRLRSLLVPAGSWPSSAIWARSPSVHGYSKETAGVLLWQYDIRRKDIDYNMNDTTTNTSVAKGHLLPGHKNGTAWDNAGNSFLPLGTPFIFLNGSQFGEPRTLIPQFKICVV